MKISKRQLRRIIQEEIMRFVEQADEPGKPTLLLTLGASDEQPVITHADSDKEVVVLDYASAEELIDDVYATLGQYDSSAVVLDEEGLGVGDVPLSQVYDAIIGMA
jgi:hypothetical protein